MCGGRIYWRPPVRSNLIIRNVQDTPHSTKQHRSRQYATALPICFKVGSIAPPGIRPGPPPGSAL